MRCCIFITSKTRNQWALNKLSQEDSRVNPLCIYLGKIGLANLFLSKPYWKVFVPIKTLHHLGEVDIPAARMEKFEHPHLSIFMDYEHNIPAYHIVCVFMRSGVKSYEHQYLITCHVLSTLHGADLTFLYNQFSPWLNLLYFQQWQKASFDIFQGFCIGSHQHPSLSRQTWLYSKAILLIKGKLCLDWSCLSTSDTSPNSDTVHANKDYMLVGMDDVERFRDLWQRTYKNLYFIFASISL